MNAYTRMDENFNACATFISAYHHEHVSRIIKEKLMAGLQPGLKVSPGTQGLPLPAEEEQPTKKGLARVWQVMKMLYQNEVTR